MIYLAAVAVVTAIGIALLLLRNRPNTSMEAGIDDFRRSLQALSPDGSRRAAGRVEDDDTTDPYEDE